MNSSDITIEEVQGTEAIYCIVEDDQQRMKFKGNMAKVSRIINQKYGNPRIIEKRR